MGLLALRTDPGGRRLQGLPAKLLVGEIDILCR